MSDFEVYAHRYPFCFAPWRYPAVLAELLLRSAGTFLDSGAGDGGKLQTLIMDGLLENFDRILASDISEERVKRLRELLPSVQAFSSDSLHLSLPDQSVDFYFSDQVIEHVPDDRSMVMEMRRVVRSGGVAFVGSVLKQAGAWYFYRNNGHWCIDPTHLREYESVERYAALFEKSGFTVEKIGTTPLAFPLLDPVIRVLHKTRILSRSGADSFYAKNGFFRALHGLKVPIPRYATIHALLRAN